MKMWDGRFSKETDGRVNDFNSSIRFDRRMYREDITGSLAHAEMLGRCGIIPADEAELICRTLRDILADIESGTLEISTEAEDIHMFVEAELTARIGEAGKRLHTARSRNDQVALDLRMYLKRRIDGITGQITGLLDVIKAKAEAHTGTVMPGYTHLQRAQPLTFAHYILAYAQMFMRDAERLRRAWRSADVMPLGSGALAGTTYPIDREFVAERLGFSAITENSIDGVSDRDFAIELAAALSVMMMHLSRFSEEIILWCSTEFGFIELDDAFATGSSIMPQKKNPDVAELVRGKCGRVYGDLMTLLSVMKSLPLAYNKDMQEDKEAIFDALDTAEACLEAFTPMLATLTVREPRMEEAVRGGFLNATDCADYLVRRGLAFRDAYKITGRLVALCNERGIALDELPLGDYRALSPAFGKDIYEAISPRACVEGRSVRGGPAEESVRRQIRLLGEFIERGGGGDEAE